MGPGVGCGPSAANALAPARTRLHSCILSRPALPDLLTCSRATCPLPLQLNKGYKQYQANLQAIVDFNLKHPTATWWAAPNQFTDLSYSEFSQRALGTNPSFAPANPLPPDPVPGGSRKLLQGASSASAPPIAVDW